MSGSVTVVGLGPGDPRLLTQAASEALAQAQDLIGYIPYVARVPDRPGLTKHATDNRVEIDRAGHALRLAASGRRVAVVSGGDPGVFAMAAAIFEAVETGDPAWRHLTITVEPGITAMLAAAARLGAPLGGDFCAMSLSDNLKPWEVITARLEAVLRADFVISLYNPISSARPWQLGAALGLAAEHRPPGDAGHLRPRGLPPGRGVPDPHPGAGAGDEGGYGDDGHHRRFRHPADPAR